MGKRDYVGLAEEESARRKGSRISGGAPSNFLTRADNYTRATWGLGLLLTGLVVAAFIMSIFGVIAYYNQNHDIEHDIHEIKHQILNARRIPDRNTFTDDDDDGPDDDDDDDDDGDDDDHDWAIYSPVLAGRVEFIDGFDKDGNPIDGLVNFDRVPVTIWDENLVVSNGTVTSQCTNDVFNMTVAAGSPNIPKAGGVGAWGPYAWLGFADYQESRVVTGTDTSSLSEARLGNTTSVLVYTDASDVLSFILKEIDPADGTTTSSTPVVLEATALTDLDDQCRFRVAAHGVADHFVVVWQTPTTGGIDAMLVHITNYAVPTATFSPVVTLVGGTDAKPNLLEYASNNNFVLGYAEDGVGAQLVTITADTTLNTVVFNAPVLLSALFDDDCGVVEGGVRSGGAQFVAVYGGNGLLDITAEVFDISALGVLASANPGVVVYASTTATFKAKPQSTGRLILEINDYTNYIFGIVQVFNQVSNSIATPAVATAVYAGHPGVPISTGLVSLIEPEVELEILDDTAFVIGYISTTNKGIFSEVAQVWDVVVNGASISLLPGDVEVYNDIDSVDVDLTVLSPTRIVLSYGDIIAGPSSNEIYTANGVIEAFDAVNGRGVRFVQAKPTHPVGIALNAAAPGEEVAVLVSGCLTDSDVFNFPVIGDLCLHGDGVLKSNCFAIPGQEDDAVPRKIAHARSKHSIVLQAPWTVDFP